MTLSRRKLFRLLAAAPAFAARGAESGFIVRSHNPEDFEMPLDGFSTWLTPADKFFIRTHLYRPTVDANKWRLKVGGQVANPLTLDMAELKKLPRAEVVSVIECAGNGRSFYQPTVTGLQWRYGAVANIKWTGVRLGDVLKKAGMKSSTIEVMFNGADVPMGTMPDFVRCLPLAKAMHADTLLAYEMNGGQIPASHGFPLRLIVPGWAGDCWVKWVTDIEARDTEFDGFFMKTAYRRPMKTLTPGAAADPAQMTPVSWINPKSVISSPREGQKLTQAAVTIHGAAWSGESPIAKVDVSTDNGRTWRPAKLGADQSRYSWRLWDFSWTPPAAGSYVLMAQATDSSGKKQPFAEEWNPSGYLYNVVHQVRVEVGATAAPGPELPPAPNPPFPPKAKASCVGCHAEEMITGQHLTHGQWEKEVDKMMKWGAQVKPEDRAALIDFLSSHFK